MQIQRHKDAKLEHTEHHSKAENLFTGFMTQETESNSVTKDVTSDIARKPERSLEGAMQQIQRTMIRNLKKA